MAGFKTAVDGEIFVLFNFGQVGVFCGENGDSMVFVG